MKKIYNTAELSIVRVATRDIIVTSPAGLSLSGTTATPGEYTTDGSNSSDYVW